MNTVFYWYQGLFSQIDHDENIVLMNWSCKGKAEDGLHDKVIAISFLFHHF